MWLTCEDGTRINVGIAHTNVEWPQSSNPRHRDLRHRRRATKVWVVCDGSPTKLPFKLEGWSICAPDDMFSRKVGRTNARNDVIARFESPIGEFLDESSRMTRELLRESNLPGNTSYADLFTRNDRKKIYAVLFPEYHQNGMAPRRSTWASSEADDKEIVVAAPGGGFGE